MLPISNMGSSPSKVFNQSSGKDSKAEDSDKWAESVPNSNNSEDNSDDSKNKKSKKITKVSPMIMPNEDNLPLSRRDNQDEKKNHKVDKIVLTEGVIQDYVNLEKAVHRLERKNVIKKYEAQTIKSDDLKNSVEQLEAVLKELRKQTEREKYDLANIEQPSIKDYLKNQGTWDERYAKEKSEYMKAIEKQEKSETELQQAKINHQHSLKITEIYKKQTDTLYGLYDQQDKLLASIVGSDYASEKENVLEGEVDDMLDWQQRVSLAMFKWANGRVLLVHSLTQITFGINRWIDAKAIEKENQRGRYFAAAEARNNFIAATQNVQSCRMYLNKVDFPYATESEITLMEETVSKAFKNVQDDNLMNSALKVFKETQQKVASLIQWFDKVINDTIRKDLDQANNAVIKKQKALREERLNILKKQARQDLGKDVVIEYDDVDDDELEKELKELEEKALREMDNVEKTQVSDILTHGNDNGQAIPLGKLAPIPSKEALFGDVKQKLSEHESAKKQFEKRNNLQREKQAIALKEKLRMRQQKGASKSKKESRNSQEA